MKIRGLIVLLCWAAIAVTASGQSGTAQELLEAARKTAVLDGDCTSAIKQYQAIVSKFEKTDRAVAARALQGIAECHEKGGSTADALRVYGLLVRDYKTYPAVVAEASGRINALAPGNTARVPSEKLATMIPIEDEAISQVSRDGRYVVIASGSPEARADGLVALGLLRDLHTGAGRVVIEVPAKPRSWPISSASLSRNGDQLAYVVSFERAPGQVLWQVLIADLGGSGVPKGRVIAETVNAGGACQFGGYRIFGWTPDGQSIALRHRVAEDTQEIALMSTKDGSLRVLKTTAERAAPFNAALSPDGRYLAAEVDEHQGSTCDGAMTRNISVFPVDGGPETTLVQFPGDDRLMGWSPDGRAVLFTSTRGGDSDLWMQRLGQGRVAPEAETVRAGFAPSRSLGVTDAGHLYTVIDAQNDMRIKEATFDFGTGTFTSVLSDMPLPYVRSNRNPRWSPDGRWLAYVSDRPLSDRILVVRSTETGVSREFKIYVGTWAWSPDSRGLVAVGGPAGTATDRRGLSYIDAESGVISSLAADANGLPEWSADGRTMFYDRRGATSAPADATRIARDLNANREREIGPAGSQLSPDGRKVYLTQGTGPERRIVERDLAAGTDRELLKLPDERADWRLLAGGATLVVLSDEPSKQETVITSFTIADASTKTVRLIPARLRLVLAAPDGRSLIVRPNSNGAPFWWVPLDGRAPRRLTELEGLDVPAGGLSQQSLHPDGRRLAVGVSYGLDPAHQLRVLENILPPVRR